MWQDVCRPALATLKLVGTDLLVQIRRVGFLLSASPDPPRRRGSSICIQPVLQTAEKALRSNAFHTPTCPPEAVTAMPPRWTQSPGVPPESHARKLGVGSVVRRKGNGRCMQATE